MNSAVVDLRSDTLTRPSSAMRAAMAAAEVGDDSYGEDPTVRALQEAFAERVGKEAALYTPSGTMANQLAIRVLARPGTAIIAGRNQHVVAFEGGAAARNHGVQFHEADDTDGWFDAQVVRDAVAASAHHRTACSLVAVEDTAMVADGSPWPIDALRAVRDAASAAHLPVHLDGARLFHSEVATGVSAAERASCATTLMCCTSKGLGAPVGSLLAGPADVIAAAREERQRLGGNMRQSGIIAAASLMALRGNVARLADDHVRASRLADALVELLPEGAIRRDRVRTNIVTFEHPRPEELIDRLAADGILTGTVAPTRMRLVTHLDVDDAGITRAIDALAAALRDR